jgi:hypothetical protein
MLKEKPTMLVDENNKTKESVWSPSMGDYEKTNSQNDSQDLRKDQIKYRATIAILITTMIVLLLGSILYFNL